MAQKRTSLGRDEREGSEFRELDADFGKSGDENVNDGALQDDASAELQALLSTVIDESLWSFVGKLKTNLSKDVAPSVADAIRLVALRQDLEGDEPANEIEVRWVESFWPSPLKE